MVSLWEWTCRSICNLSNIFEIIQSKQIDVYGNVWWWISYKIKQELPSSMCCEHYNANTEISLKGLWNDSLWKSAVKNCICMNVYREKESQICAIALSTSLTYQEENYGQGNFPLFELRRLKMTTEKTTELHYYFTRNNKQFKRQTSGF